MRIRIHETDFTGRPVQCTGDYYEGETALRIVEAIKMTPFLADMEPLAYMRETLDRIGLKSALLPDDPTEAAVMFLHQLTANGYAKFDIGNGENKKNQNNEVSDNASEEKKING